MSPRKAGTDRYLFWPAVVSIGALLIAGWTGAYEPFGLLVFGLIAAIASFWVALAAGFLFWHGRWRGAISLSIFPLAVVAAIAAPAIVLRPFLDLGIYLRFLAMRPACTTEITLPNAMPRSHFCIFDWSGFAG